MTCPGKFRPSDVTPDAIHPREHACVPVTVHLNLLKIRQYEVSTRSHLSLASDMQSP